MTGKGWGYDLRRAWQASADTESAPRETGDVNPEDAMGTTEEKREAARPVLVRDWMDLFTFEPATEVMCPDCDAVSPEVGNVFAAAKWAEKHSGECTA